MNESSSSDLAQMARTRSGVDVAVFADTEEIVKVDNVLVDESLPMSLISKSMVNDLGVEYEAAEHGDCQDEDSDEVKTIIGKVELQWHRRGSGRSHRELFNVVDTTSSLFVLKSLPKEGSEVFSFGLDQVTEAEKIRQQQRKQDVQKARSIQKAEQEQRQDQKQSVPTTRP